MTSKNRVLSAGTFLDTIRFRLQIARSIKCSPLSVDALVLGEHGTTAVYEWSLARIGGESVLNFVERRGEDPTQFRNDVELAVKYANINIIDGTKASQHGISGVTARIVEAILGDEGLVMPIGDLYGPRFRVTLSLPAVIGRLGVDGVKKVLMPSLTAEENRALQKSAEAISDALEELGPI